MSPLVPLVLALSASLSAGAATPGDGAAAAVAGAVSAFASFLERDGLSQLELPDIGRLPDDPIRLRGGRLGNFSTLQVQRVAAAGSSALPDGSTSYFFDVALVVDRFLLRYDYSLNSLVGRRVGILTLETLFNSFRAAGSANVRQDGTCDANLYDFEVSKFGHFRIRMFPGDDPRSDWLSEMILGYISPSVTSMTNKALGRLIRVQLVQNEISEIICKAVKL